MNDFLNSLAPEIQGAALVLIGTIVAAALQARPAIVAAREKRVAEIRALVRDCALHADSMTSLTYQLVEMLQKQNERGLNEDDFRPVLAMINEQGSQLRTGAFALVNSSDARIMIAGDVLYQEIKRYRGKYSYLGINGADVDLEQLELDGQKLLDIVSVMANMVTSRWWERVRRFRGIRKAERKFIRARNINNMKNSADSTASESAHDGP